MPAIMPQEATVLLETLRSLAGDAPARAAALCRRVRASQAAADARAAVTAARRRWDRSRLRLDPDMARALLAVVEEETVPGVAPLKTTVFEKERCRFCRNIHSGHCPAVREIEYHPDGRVARVSYFPRWNDSAVLRLEDVKEAAAWGDAPNGGVGHQ